MRVSIFISDVSAIGEQSNIYDKIIYIYVPPCTLMWKTVCQHVADNKLLDATVARRHVACSNMKIDTASWKQQVVLSAVSRTLFVGLSIGNLFKCQCDYVAAAKFFKMWQQWKKNELMCNIATPTLRRAIALHRQLHATNCKEQWESAEWLLISLSLLPPMLLLLLLFLFIHLNARCVLQKCN